MSGATDMTPRPTEYRGVVYRSKSEAMFARRLELRDIIERAGKDPVVQYEPSWATIGDWTPDFFQSSCESWELPFDVPDSREDGPHWLPGVTMLHALIEYKPLEPTPTYIKEIGRKFAAIDRKILGSTIWSWREDFRFLIAYGSVWNRRGRILFTMNRGPGDEPIAVDHWVDDWMTDREIEIVKQTRFDLKAAAGVLA